MGTNGVFVAKQEIIMGHWAVIMGQRGSVELSEVIGPSVGGPCG